MNRFKIGTSHKLSSTFGAVSIPKKKIDIAAAALENARHIQQRTGKQCCSCVPVLQSGMSKGAASVSGSSTLLPSSGECRYTFAVVWELSIHHVLWRAFEDC